MSSVEPLELGHVLDCVWRVVSAAYDVSAARPEASAMLEGADRSAPRDAACAVLVNILSEAPEHIGRFAPWYKMPARAFQVLSL